MELRKEDDNEKWKRRCKSVKHKRRDTDDKVEVELRQLVQLPRHLLT